MKTIGTLEEIGAQVGDVVEYVPAGGHSTIVRISGGRYYNEESKGDTDHFCAAPHFRIITKAAKSPVRTVTRKEIVPGVYGRICIDKSEDTEKVALCFTGQYAPTGVSVLTASDLTAAIATLTEIRDAMENP